MSGIEKLGNTINNRILKVMGGNEALKPEIGSITDNLGLTVQSVKNTIGKEDYLVEAQTKLKAGDRVLTIWCGMEPVIAAVLREGSENPIDPNAPAGLIDILAKAFPVGTVTMTASTVNPSELMGGMWEEGGDVFFLDGDGASNRELYSWEKKAHEGTTIVEVAKTDADAVLGKAYPPGCIYFSSSPTSPSVLFGGTWKDSEDAFVLSADGSADRTLYSFEKVADTVHAEATEAINSAVRQLWPVGSIYVSSAEQNPADSIGGTWKDSGDIFVLSADGKASRALHTWERTE